MEVTKIGVVTKGGFKSTCDKYDAKKTHFAVVLKINDNDGTVNEIVEAP